MNMPEVQSNEEGGDDKLIELLQKLLPSIEHAIERIPIENLAFSCSKCCEYFGPDDFITGGDPNGKCCDCEGSSRPKIVEKRDSCIQTSPIFEIYGSIPHIDSDEEECRQDVEDSSLVKNFEKVSGPVSTGTMTRRSRELVQPKSIDELPQKVLLSGIHLPGAKDSTERPVIVIHGSTIVKDSLTRNDTAKTLLYYATLLGKSQTERGVTVLLIPDSGSKSGKDDDCLFDLLDQAFDLVKKYLKIYVVYAWIANSSNVNQRWLKSIVFPRANVKCRCVTDEASLHDVISLIDLPQSCGGKAPHDQLEWVEFFRELEPFVSLCRSCGRRLVDLLSDLEAPGNCQIQISSRLIYQQQKFILRTLSDSDLKKLGAEGCEILSKLEERARWIPSSPQVRNNLEVAKRLFGEIDRTAKRLENFLENRQQRIKEIVRIRVLEEESSQVLSWLIKKGEETLKKHSELATSLQGIKKQEQDFEKFYFVSMRHLDKGNDLLDESKRFLNDSLPTDGPNTTGLRQATKSLKLHIKGFGERLEDTREMLEDTSRCYHLVDKIYEWSLETSKYVNRIKFEDCLSEETANQMSNNIRQRLLTHPPISESHFSELSALIKKLNDEKLLEQFRIAHARYRETVETVRNAQSRLTENLDSFPNLPNLEVSCMSGACHYGRRKSLGSFPYIYKCNHHAAGHDCACDGSVTKDPYKMGTNRNRTLSPRRCDCEKIFKEACENDLADDKCGNWECDRSVNKSLLRRTSTWQYPTEGFENHENRCNRSSRSEESDVKDLEDHEGEIPNSIPTSLTVNSHLYRHASDLSLNISSDQIEDPKTQKTLRLIMREMVQTERDYVASLEYVIENYIPELLREDIPQALRGQRNVVFGNIEKIHEFHSRHFLQELENNEKNPLSVGQSFLRHEKKFYLYALYNKNKPKSDSLMTEYGSAFFKTKQIQLGDKMDLASYLLKPVQRMGKYALLLQQLMKASGNKDSSDLSAAESMVRFQLRHGNDLLAMDSLRDCDVNLKEQGRLLRQNEFLVWQGKGKKCLRHVFLFEELILFSKARRFPDRKNLDIYIYKNSIKTTDIGLTAKIGDSPTKFEIWFRKRKPNDTFTLQPQSEEVKQVWVEELSSLLWKQALKNREMRLQEMSSMGIGNKPCLDIRSSANQIIDRSISRAQLANKTVPRPTRNSMGFSNRPHSIISVTSSSSSGGSSGSGSHIADSPTLPRSTLHSQCSTESGIIADISLGSEDLEGRGTRWHLERSNSTVTSGSSLDSSLSPTSCADDTSDFANKIFEEEATTEI